MHYFPDSNFELSVTGFQLQPKQFRVTRCHKSDIHEYMLILCFGDILSTLADRESVLGVAESQQHLHLRELDRIRHTAEHPTVMH